MKRKTIIIAFLISALLFGGCAAAYSMSEVVSAASPATVVLQATAVPEVTADPALSTTPETGLPVASESTLLALQGTFENIYEDVSPSVVSIQVIVGGTQGLQFGGSGQGSGFVWDTQGHIVTNNHVVEGATEIMVVFSDGTMVDADLIGRDPNADLAVVKVDLPASQLRPVRMADSSLVKVGQLAIAIGNPFGLANTMTEGIISALSRSLPVDSTATSGGSYTIPDIIQTDAAINPGNSGGVLLNVQGEVVGVPTAIRSSSNVNSGIGFVIPANIVKRVVPMLIETGSYDHPRMGISGVTLNAQIAEALDLDPTLKGVLVREVSAGSPAEQAGLQGGSLRQTGAGQQIETGGDIIIAIDDLPVTKFEDITSYLFNNTQVGQTVTLTILRQGQEQAVPLTLGVLP